MLYFVTILQAVPPPPADGAWAAWAIGILLTGMGVLSLVIRALYRDLRQAERIYTDELHERVRVLEGLKQFTHNLREGRRP